MIKNFKVGDRVRVISITPQSHWLEYTDELISKVGTIKSITEVNKKKTIVGVILVGYSTTYALAPQDLKKVKEETYLLAALTNKIES